MSTHQTGKATVGDKAALVERNRPRERRLSYLIDQLQGVIFTHSSARIEVHCAIQTMAYRLNTEYFLIAGARAQKDRWHRPTLMDLAIEELSPVLASMLPLDHLTGWESWNGCALFPVAEKLSTCAQCAEAERQLRKYVDEVSRFEEGRPDLATDHHHSLGESLHAVADVLLHVQQAWPSPPLRWCHVCFRRAPKSSGYCNVHRPGEKHNGTDTIYRKARRTYLALGADALRSLARSQAHYRALAGQSAILNDVSLIALLPEKASIVRNPVIAKWLQWSEHPEHWPAMATAWRQVIAQEFPKSARCISKPASDFPSWSAFAKHVCEKLDNRIERAINPITLLHMLDDAETIFEAAPDNKDGRRTGSYLRILELSQSGQTQADIARELGMSKQYVSNVLGAQQTAERVSESVTSTPSTPPVQR